MAEIALAAKSEGFKLWGITPHSPVPIASPCNMNKDNVREYLRNIESLKDEYSGRMDVLGSMEIDYLSPDWGPHIDYFQNLPLDYRLGSVHFVPTQDGRLIDCDGSPEKFLLHLVENFKNDIRYVVEKYFEQVLMMIDKGGFDLLGHFDKIAGNASVAFPEIEQEGWYESLVKDVMESAVSGGLVVEINTKAYENSGRFFPAERWWGELKKRGCAIVFNSDAHFAGKVASGRKEAIELFCKVPDNL